MATTPDRFAKPIFSRAVVFNPEPIDNPALEQPSTRFTRHIQQYSQVVQDYAPVNSYENDYGSSSTGRFEMPDRPSRHISLQESSSESQRPEFSNPRTQESRLQIKPFGAAVDRERNEKCTTYGEDTFIEYNPMVFFGPAGLKRINNYYNNVIAGLAKEIPVIPPQIILKDYNAGNSNPAECETTCNNIDWWADDINEYIQNYEKLEPVTCQHGYQPAALEILIPEVLDKLKVASKLIKDYRVHDQDKPAIQFRDPELYDTTAIGANRPTPQARFQAPATLSSRNPVAETEPETNGRFSMLSSRQRGIPHETPDARVYYDDNCTIKISNFGDAHILDVYDIKDFLREHGLDSAEIKYKVTMPKNKETGQARDFIYLNFCDDAGLTQALNILLGQRIAYEYGILSVERVEPRGRR